MCDTRFTNTTPDGALTSTPGTLTGRQPARLAKRREDIAAISQEAMAACGMRYG